MIYPLRNSFIGLLILLQLLLPLLHAHSGMDNSPGGIHLHNPELLSLVDNTFDQSIVGPTDKLIPAEEIIVVASTGIRHKAALLEEAQDILFLNIDVQYFPAPLAPIINIFPHTDFYSYFRWNPSSPRAPPVYSILT